MNAEDFDKWLDEKMDKGVHIPFVAWGPSHTLIAVMFANDMAKGVVNKALDVALNEGDGSYKP